MAKRSLPKEKKKDAGPVIENRKARHDYFILDTVEVGIVLQGSEVKSIRDGKVSLGEGYVRVEGYGVRRSAKVDGQSKDAKAKDGKARKSTAPRRGYEPGLFLHAVNIGEYGPAGRAGTKTQHPPTRTRTLLAHKRELAKLAREVQIKGITIVPLKIYFNDHGKAKLLIGLAQGKQAHDKRQTIAKRDAERDMNRAMSKRM